MIMCSLMLHVLALASTVIVSGAAEARTTVVEAAASQFAAAQHAEGHDRVAAGPTPWRFGPGRGRRRQVLPPFRFATRDPNPCRRAAYNIVAMLSRSATEPLCTA
jgi:hypothetical protein